jgi:hypothetical protein
MPTVCPKERMFQKRIGERPQVGPEPPCGEPSGPDALLGCFEASSVRFP